MASSHTSQDIVNDFLSYKLRKRGVAWLRPTQRQLADQRRRSEALSVSSWRSERAMAWRRGGAGWEEDPHQDPCVAPPPLVQVVLRCAGDQLEQRYRSNLSAHVSALLSHQDELLWRLAAVRDELFRGGVNWGRIVALMELGGAVSAAVASTEGAGQVDDIARWMMESLDSPPLKGWIEDNGGWDAFVELYSESRPAVTSWSLRTLVGLAVVGAAGIILGVLLTRK